MSKNSPTFSCYNAQSLKLFRSLILFLFYLHYLFHQVFDEITRLVLSMKKDKLAKNNNSVNVKEPIKLQANSKKKKACNCG